MSDIHYDATSGGKPLVQERAAVAKGAQFLDKVLPGWYNEIEFDRLDMSSGAMCMMGQLFGTEVESKLAETMYPEEMSRVREDDSGWYCRDGYDIAQTWAKPTESFIATLARKVGLDFRRKETQAQFLALRHVCSGHSNECLWAEQIAERKAREAEGGKASSKRARA